MAGSKFKLGILAMIGVFMLLLFASSVFENLNAIATRKLAENGNMASNVANVLDSDAYEEEQKYFYLGEAKKTQPKVSALSYLVGDLHTGEIILAKNIEKKSPIASTSKVMTALLAEELGESEELATVSKRALRTEGANGNLKAGEKIKINELLYPLLLESSNDAAEVIAEHYGRDVFMQKMNQAAQALGMSGTFYEDPSGLSSANQSTVSDLFKLARYVYENKPRLLQITTKRSYADKKHSWSNTNQLIKKQEYEGGKSGYTAKAKQTLVSFFSLPLGNREAGTTNRKVAITLLQSTNRALDVENILKYLKKNIYYGGLKDAKSGWVKIKTDTQESSEPDFVKLLFAGDLMLDRGVRISVIKNFNNDYSALFEKLEILKNADIAFANLEGTASDRGVDQKNLYSFRMDPAVIPAISGAGINILSVANNHVGDWGREAYIDTIARLKENEILATGGGMSKEEAEKPTIIEKYGIKIGYLGFSDVGPNHMKAETDKPGILLGSDPRFEEIIKNAAGQVDHLVVSFHFGEEYKTKHNKRQEELAHKAIDSGAKIVIGHHPHVIQDTEIYKNGFIAYSLGNFIFDQSWSASTMQGMLLEVELHKDGNMSIRKNTVKLNKAFQPDQIIRGKEEKVKF